MTHVAVVTVAWNTRDLLSRCLTSLQAALDGSGLAYTVIVVDNDSADGTAAMVRAEHPGVLLLESGRNLGFAGGNNLGLRHILSPHAGSLTPHPSPPDYLLLLNPDTEIIGDAIGCMARYLAAHPDVAAVGPLLRYPDGSVQSSRRRFPSPAVFFWESTPLEWRWPSNPWVRRYRMAERTDDIEQDVDWLVGAALMVRRTAIERAGLLDSGFALYSEEIEWQLRLSRCGRIVYLPQAQVIHHEGRSSEQVPARRLSAFHQSRLRYIRMVFGPGLAGVVRTFLQLAYGAELAGEALKWLVGHRRKLRAGRVSVYARLLSALAGG